MDIKHSWAYSSLKQYESCNHKEWHRRNKTPVPKTTEMPEHLQRGIDTHKGIELFLKGEGELPDMNFPKYQFDKLKSYVPATEYKIGVDINWNAVPWNEAWGRMILDSWYVTCHYDHSDATIVDFKTGMPHTIRYYDEAAVFSVGLQAKFPEFHKIEFEFWYVDHDTVLYPRVNVFEAKQNITYRAMTMTTDEQLVATPNKYKCAFCKYASACDFADDDWQEIKEKYTDE